MASDVPDPSAPTGYSSDPGQPGKRRRRLGEVLVEHGVLTEEQLEECLAVQKQAGPGSRRRLGLIVVEQGYATERDLASALAEALDLRLVDLATTLIESDAARLVPRHVADRYGVLVLGRVGRGLRVAMADPTNVVALDDIRMHTGASELQVVVASEGELRTQLQRIWSMGEGAAEVVTMLDDVEVDTDDMTGTRDQDSAPIVRLVDVLLSDAVRLRASDLHVEPQAGNVRIRFRIDGLLRDIMTVPRGASPALISRFKIISALDISERRRPQDGRARIQVGEVPLEVRVSTLPTLHGEKVVVRLLARSGEVQPLTASGFEPEQLALVEHALTAPQGLIMITGPTGSGKTSTLYAAVAQIKTPDRNIVTLEDPVEVAIPGAVQVQVHERVGMTFAKGLRSILRQDPDIILLGEIRDTETAELALRASLTGHLVMTTLHTNDAVSAITRLIEMGNEPFLLASSLSMVVGQRLVRKPCTHCAAPYIPSPRTMAMLGITEADLADSSAVRGRGCLACGDSGYLGRIGVFEVLPVTAAMRAVLLATPDERSVAAAARAAGMVTMREAGLAKALRGETTFEEVLRVTHVDTREGSKRCATCGRGLGDDMVCCPWCSTVVDTGHCATCARSLDPGWRTCPWCRTPVPPRGISPIGVDEPDLLPRVLVVDDDHSVCAFTAAALSGVASVDYVLSAEEGLRAISLTAYDAIILDLRLPDLSGLEVVRLLRADPRTVLLPILLFTGSQDPREEAEARLAGADDWITKPADPDVLESRMTALLSRNVRT